MLLYRKISRMFAIGEMALMAIAVTCLVYFGVIVCYYTFSNTKDTQEMLAMWSLFIILVMVCYIKLLADVRLIFATSKDVDPQSAIQYCELWLWVYSISLAIWILSLIVLIIFNVVNTYDSTFILCCAIVLLRAIILQCVRNYKRELKNVLLITSTMCSQRNNETLTLPRLEAEEREMSHSPSIVTETRMPFIPMNYVIDAGGLPVASIANSTDDLPSYDDVTLDIDTDSSPPPYNEIISNDQMK